jgi:hypothetical protein
VTTEEREAMRRDVPRLGSPHRCGPDLAHIALEMLEIFAKACIGGAPQRRRRGRDVLS